MGTDNHHARIREGDCHSPRQIIDNQIPVWIKFIGIDAVKVPLIRKAYQSQIKRLTNEDRDETITGLQRQLLRLKAEESQLGRMLLTNKISEEAYDQLRKEWKEKVQRIEVSIADLEREALARVDDLEAALTLMTRIGLFYDRLGEKEQSTLLQILVKQFIVDRQGKIIDYELHPPFAFIQDIVEELSILELESHNSFHVFAGAQ